MENTLTMHNVSRETLKKPKRKSVKVVCPTEHQEQVLLADWCKVYKDKRVQLMYAVPNGAGKKTLTGRLYYWRELLRGGIPDLCLPVPIGKYGALYIEMKRRNKKISSDGGLTDNQITWIAKLNDAGNLAVVCYGFEEARNVIIEYLKGK